MDNATLAAPAAPFAAPKTAAVLELALDQGWFVQVDVGQAHGGWSIEPDGGEAYERRRVAATGAGSGGLDTARAERVIWATVATLAERMRHDELVQLGARLPHELQAPLRAGSPTCQPFGADEFVCRVAERVGVEPHAAWTQVRAVLGTLERELAEMEEVRQRLPREFDALMA